MFSYFVTYIDQNIKIFKILKILGLSKLRLIHNFVLLLPLFLLLIDLSSMSRHQISLLGTTLTVYHDKKSETEAYEI